MSKKNKTQALKEARRAQFAVNREGFAIAQKFAEVKKSSHDSYFELPIPEIRKDLLKNIGFLIFSVALLIVLEKTRFGYSQLISNFKI